MNRLTSAMVISSSLAIQPGTTQFRPPLESSFGENDHNLVPLRHPVSIFDVPATAVRPDNSGWVTTLLTWTTPADRTKSKLLSFFELPSNWDGEGSASPITGAIHEALQMLDALPKNFPSPRAMALPSGDVALFWDFNGIFAEIGFSGAGILYAYGQGADGIVIHLDDEPIELSEGKTKFPNGIMNIIGPALRAV